MPRTPEISITTEIATLDDKSDAGIAGLDDKSSIILSRIIAGEQLDQLVLCDKLTKSVEWLNLFQTAREVASDVTCESM
jgi:hypothetical protein